MALWVVRAGRYGERESYALEHGRAVIGWDELPVLSGAGSREEVERIIREHCPEFAPAQVASHTGQIWTFLHRIETEDLIVLPLRVTTRSAIVRSTLSSLSICPQSSPMYPLPAAINAPRATGSPVCALGSASRVLFRTRAAVVLR